MNPWIIIPVFNEAGTVGRVVSAARRYGPVLVIDDGSTDASGAVARVAGGEVIRHPRRLGKGQALRTGMVAVRQRGATHVVTLDGDGQHAPEDLPAVLAAARESPSAIIIGSRVGADGEARGAVPASRLNAIRVAGFFVDWASGLSLRDTQSGFRAYPVAWLDQLHPRRGGLGFGTGGLEPRGGPPAAAGPRSRHGPRWPCRCCSSWRRCRRWPGGSCPTWLRRSFGDSTRRIAWTHSSTLPRLRRSRARP